MTRSVAFHSYKGGTGKTTLAANLAAAALVNAAAMTAIKEHVTKKEGDGDELKASMRHFEAALDKIKPKESSGRKPSGEPKTSGDV